MSLIKRTAISIIAALALTAIAGTLTYILVQLFYPLIGYWTILFAIISILFGSIAYYRLTSILSSPWAMLGLLLNVLLWFGLQVIFGKYIHNSLLHQEQEMSALFMLAISSLLFGFNKVIIEEIFCLIGAKRRSEMRIEKIINRTKAK